MCVYIYIHIDGSSATVLDAAKGVGSLKSKKNNKQRTNNNKIEIRYIYIYIYICNKQKP